MQRDQRSEEAASAPLRPRKNPCPSCPYRRDVPSGVWDESEYEKLLRYDLPTGSQPPGVFMCHQGDGYLCSGWCAVHGDESLGLRLGVSFGQVDPESIGYTTTVPLHPSGRAAYEHGMREYLSPGQRAVDTITKIVKKNGGTGHDSVE